MSAPSPDGVEVWAKPLQVRLSVSVSVSVFVSACGAKLCEPRVQLCYPTQQPDQVTPPRHTDVPQLGLLHAQQVFAFQLMFLKESCDLARHAA